MKVIQEKWMYVPVDDKGEAVSHRDFVNWMMYEFRLNRVGLAQVLHVRASTVTSYKGGLRQLGPEQLWRARNYLEGNDMPLFVTDPHAGIELAPISRVERRPRVVPPLAVAPPLPDPPRRARKPADGKNKQVTLPVPPVAKKGRKTA